MSNTTMIDLNKLFFLGVMQGVICGESKNLSYPVQKYICDTCRYPRCDVCHQTERPRHGKYSVTKLPAWTCKHCRVCTKCGTSLKPMEGHTELRLCAACRNPPCSVCNIAQRPSSTRHSVDVLPVWTCDACRSR